MLELQALYDIYERHHFLSPERTIERGHYLHHQGMLDQDIYYVVSGALMSYVLVNNEECCLRFGYQGNFYGAPDSFVYGRPTIMNTRALRQTVIQSVSYDHHLALLDQDYDYASYWQDLTGWMIVSQMDREVDLLTASPEDRLRRVLARSPQLFQEVPAKYIANYLRMSPETLSRIRK